MFAMDSGRTFSVSDITGIIKEILEGTFTRVTIEGEVSNFKPASSGHAYFVLKDEEAMIQAVMFRGRLSGLSFTPRDGMLVRATGNISVYGKRGTYQIICDQMEQAGTGNILAMLEERKRRLAAEGLFDQARKKSLPLLPKRVGVVTSPTGAALRDILQVLGRRNASLNLLVLPAPVQGTEAAPLIAAQIRRANRLKLADVLIVGRGGGSIEDLLPFSEEVVVRAIAESEIPVISAVGHEIDNALSDYAADLRAPTPSAAAELVSASREQLEDRVSGAAETIRTMMIHRIERTRVILGQFKQKQLAQSFRVLVQPVTLRLDDARETIIDEMLARIRTRRHAVELASGTLTAASPLAVLERGFSIVYNEKGEPIRSAQTLETGDRVSIRFHTGRAQAAIEETSV